MDILSLAYSNAYSQLRQKSISSLKRAEEKRQLLYNPDKLDKKVASVAQALSPSARKPRGGRGRTKIEAVDRVIPGDHPMKGFGKKLAIDFQQLLASDKMAAYDADEILQKLAIHKYITPDKETGKIPLESSYKYYRVKDAVSLFHPLGGGADTLAKPPGYDAWRKGENEKESRGKSIFPMHKAGPFSTTGPGEESIFASDEEIAKMATIGAALGGAAGAVTTAGLGAGPGAVMGGIAGAALEIAAHPVLALVHRSEWYKSRIHSDSILDKAKTVATDLALYTVTDKLMQVGLAKTTASAAKEIIEGLTSTDAKSVVKYGKNLAAAEDSVTDEAAARVVANKSAAHAAGVEDPAVDAAYDLVKTQIKKQKGKQLNLSHLIPSKESSTKSMGYAPSGEATAKDATAALNELNDEFFIDKVFQDPDGPVEGALKALSDQNAADYWKDKKLFTDKLKQDALAIMQGDSKHIMNMDATAYDLARRLADSARMEAAMSTEEKLAASESLKNMWQIAYGPNENLPPFLKVQLPVMHPNPELTTKIPMYFVEQLPRIDVSKTAAKNNSNLLKLFGIGAGAVLAFTAMPSDNAEAGMTSTMVKMAETFKKSGLIAEAVEEGQLLLNPENIQKGMRLGEKSIAAEFANNARKFLNRGAENNRLYNKMSPFQIFNTVMRQAKGLMLNPAVVKASYFMAEITNVDNTSKVLINILERGGVKSELGRIRQATKPLLDLAQDTFEYAYRKAEIKAIEKEAAEIIKTKYAKGDITELEDYLSTIKKELDGHKTRLKELEPRKAQYHKEHAAVMQDLAKDSPSVRIALALGGGEKKYPWLSALMTPDDQATAARVRSLLDVYKARFKARKLAVVENDFFPRQPDPRLLARVKYIDTTRVDAHAFARIAAQQGMVPSLTPDLAETMRYYIKDAESQLMNHDFWKAGGWKEIMYSPLVQNNEGLREGFRALHEGSMASVFGVADRLATHYANAEVWKRLFLSPSAGFKHSLKVFQTITSTNAELTIPSVIAASKNLWRHTLKDTALGAILGKFGIKASEQGKLVDDMFKSMIHVSNLRSLIVDSSIDIPGATMSGIKRTIDKVQDIGSTFINTAELFDRGVSVAAALGMSAKKGMTPDQAIYGVYSYILNNNFLSREFNPLWLKNPKIRALFMFQSTVFKMWERRAVMAARTGRVFTMMLGDVKKEIHAGNASEVLTQLRAVRRWIKTGENELKANLFVDGLTHETDFFGTPIAHQFVKDIAMAAGMTYGAGITANMALQHHFFHIPFLDPRDDRATLALNPAIQAAMRTWRERQYNDDDFIVTDFLHNWLGSNAVLPVTFNKAQRLAAGDIPDIYGDDSLSYLRYFLAIPTKDSGR